MIHFRLQKSQKTEFMNNFKMHRIGFIWTSSALKLHLYPLIHPAVNEKVRPYPQN